MRGFAAAPGAPGAASAGRSPRGPIRVTVAGCAGARGSWLAGAAARHPAFRVSSLVDGIPEAARVVAEHHHLGGVPVHATLADSLSREACDAVLVATPDWQHAELTIAALRAGKHVFVEKPLAVTAEDCLRIVRADQAAGGRVMVGFNLRFAPLYRKTRETIRAGELGRILTIQEDEYYQGGRTYFRRWNRLKKYGGGLWITKGCHDFDILFWMAGALPERVSASARLTHFVSNPRAGSRCSSCPIESECPDTALPSIAAQPEHWRRIFALREQAGWPPADLCLYNSDKDTFDHGIAQVEFENEALGVYSLNVAASFSDRRIRVSGSGGTFDGTLSGTEGLQWHRRVVEEPPQVVSFLPPGSDARAAHGGGDEAILDELAAFVRGEPSRAVSPAEASVAVFMGLAATLSSEGHRSVSMSDVPGWEELRGLMSPGGSGDRR